MYCTLSCPSDIIVFIMVFACVAGSWAVHHGLKPKLRKRVKTALVNSYSCRDMLSTCSLVESCLVSDAYAMEDVVIGALSKKCSRPNVPKGGGSKEAPSGKWVNTAEWTSPFKKLPPPPPTAGEANGATSSASPATLPPPARPKHRLPEDRLKYLTPYSTSFLSSWAKRIWRTLMAVPLAGWLGLCNLALFIWVVWLPTIRQRSTAITVR